jgi:predicted lipid carrier protein YhbT
LIVGLDRRISVASVDECRAALHRLAQKLADNADDVHRKVNLERRMVCHVTDLQVAFRGRLDNGRLLDLADGDDPQAKVTLSTTSDDLIALIDGELAFATALASRRVSVRANPMDLLRLRKLL